MYASHPSFTRKQGAFPAAVGYEGPVVAVIGRPNVGKSTFVNRLFGSRHAIVDDMPGVTRDRTYLPVEWRDKSFTVVDTGGLLPGDEELFTKLTNEQVLVALAEAHLVLFLVDGLAGLTPADEEIADLIRKSGKPVMVVVNKIDRPDQQNLVSEFYALGQGEPYAISAMHGSGGVGDLLDTIVFHKALKPYFAPTGTPEPAALEEDEAADSSETAELAPIRLAVVGRPNVGKSSLVNMLIGQKRSMVSDVAGTTRDAIDIPLLYEDNEYILVDTAGIRKKSKVSYGIELFSVDRAIKTIRQSDVVIVLIDAVDGITDQDQRIIGTAIESGRGVILGINKWDLIPDKTPQSTVHYQKKILAEHPYLEPYPILFLSAHTGQRVTQIFETADLVFENVQRRVKTSVLNEVIHDAVIASQPASIKNKRLKILYATQASVCPPTFVLFVNNAKLMKETYRRYLEKRLRQAFEFTGSPIRLVLRNRGDKEKTA